MTDKTKKILKIGCKLAISAALIYAGGPVIKEILGGGFISDSMSEIIAETGNLHFYD